MRKKKTWTVNEDDYYYIIYYFYNNKHYFTRNETTNEWSEIMERRSSGKTVKITLDTFKLKTFDSNSLILYSDASGQYLELSDDKAKFTFGEIESLDRVVDFYTGYWMDTNILRNKKKAIYF